MAVNLRTYFTATLDELSVPCEKAKDLWLKNRFKTASHSDVSREDSVYQAVTLENKRLCVYKKLLPNPSSIKPLCYTWDVLTPHWVKSRYKGPLGYLTCGPLMPDTSMHYALPSVGPRGNKQPWIIYVYFTQGQYNFESYFSEVDPLEELAWTDRKFVFA